MNKNVLIIFLVLSITVLASAVPAYAAPTTNKYLYVYVGFSNNKHISISLLARELIYDISDNFAKKCLASQPPAAYRSGGLQKPVD